MNASSLALLRDRWPVVQLTALLVVPVGVAAFLLLSPDWNQTIRVPTAHLMVVTLVSLLAAALAGLIARVALQLEQYKVFLVTMGFLTMAGLFAVHALATPGILLHGPGIYASGELYGVEAPPNADRGAVPVANYDGTIAGVSAFLSLFIPSGFFALAFSPSAAVLARGRLRARPVLIVALGALGVYAVSSVVNPELMVNVLPSRFPLTLAVALMSSSLLLLGAWQVARTYGRTRLPMHGALVVAFILLAEGQAVMFVAPFWTLGWWEYHVLMLVAIVISLGAVFVELDRRRGLERFVSSELVQRLVAGEALKGTGERHVLTILFADLRGSTALADELPAEEVMEVINAYVTELARCVLGQGGLVNKYIGDGIMAIFGLQADPSDGAVGAARAALDMRKSLGELSQERAASGRATLDFGVAINTGEVIVGAVGLSERADFTAIGDTVNTTSRLEGLCKEFQVDMVISANSAERLKGHAFKLQPLGEANVRGKREAIQVLTLGPSDLRPV